MKKGALIAFEGIDGAGKSTQALLLCQQLDRSGYDAVFSKEPTDGQWGRKIQTILKEGRDAITPEEELEWFLRDRKEHVGAIILPALRSGKIVVLDRYYFSTIAYQGALGLDPKEIEHRNEEFAPQPDLLFLVDISTREGLSRIARTREGGTDYFEREQYLGKVREVFLSLERPFLHRLSGDKSVKTLAGEVWEITCKRLEILGISKGE